MFALFTLFYVWLCILAGLWLLCACVLCLFCLAYSCCIPMCIVFLVWLVVVIIYFNNFFINGLNTELHKPNKRLICYILISKFGCGILVYFILLVWVLIVVVYLNSFFVISSNTELHKSNKRLISFISISKLIKVLLASFEIAYTLQVHLSSKQIVLAIAYKNKSNVTYNYVNTI